MLSFISNTQLNELIGERVLCQNILHKIDLCTMFYEALNCKGNTGSKVSISLKSFNYFFYIEYFYISFIFYKILCPDQNVSYKLAILSDEEVSLVKDKKFIFKKSN